jgi:hypothetical protein
MADEQTGDPAQAFNELRAEVTVMRAEVTVMRKALEALPAAIRENRPPDYAQDLAVIGKGLDEIGGQLETIQKSPALKMTPEQQGQSIANAGSYLIREAMEKLERAADYADTERRTLTHLIGNVHTKADQRFLIAMAAVFGLVVGLAASLPIASFMPFGLNNVIAAHIVGGEKWDAGATLLNDADPGRWAQIVADTNLVDANRDKITDCQKEAAKAKKDERCIISVKAQ